MKIVIINGPNLNMLGIREPGIYGAGTYKELLEFIENKAKELGVSVECFQSNSEGAIIDKIQACYGDADGIVINPGAYTHYSYAIHDAIKSVMIKTVEVHISDIHTREDFRRISVTAPACIRQISGLGWDGYIEAIKEIKNAKA